MARKQLGAVDDGLLARIDARAKALGQTRRVFVERACERALESVSGTGLVSEVREDTDGRVAPASSGTDSSAAEDTRCHTCRTSGPPRFRACANCGHGPA